MFIMHWIGVYVHMEKSRKLLKENPPLKKKWNQEFDVMLRFD